LGNTRIASPPPTPSKSEQAIIELKPPADTGFSGTAKFLVVEQAPLIEELLKRGYTKVER
jgi:hypothetical protein